LPKIMRILTWYSKSYAMLDRIWMKKIMLMAS